MVKLVLELVKTRLFIIGTLNYNWKHIVSSPYDWDLWSVSIIELLNAICEFTILTERIFYFDNRVTMKLVICRKKTFRLILTNNRKNLIILFDFYSFKFDSIWNLIFLHHCQFFLLVFLFLRVWCQLCFCYPYMYVIDPFFLGLRPSHFVPVFDPRSCFSKKTPPLQFTMISELYNSLFLYHPQCVALTIKISFNCIISDPISPRLIVHSSRIPYTDHSYLPSHTATHGTIISDICLRFYVTTSLLVRWILFNITVEPARISFPWSIIKIHVRRTGYKRLLQMCEITKLISTQSS